MTNKGETENEKAGNGLGKQSEQQENYAQHKQEEQQRQEGQHQQEGQEQQEQQEQQQQQQEEQHEPDQSGFADVYVIQLLYKDKPVLDREALYGKMQQ